ncbi:MAG: hypothetical protein IJO61_04450 [Oscillospiraceae bacterium]|nr:hypothetical protein [Oscillospiraceae bacterium]
MKKKLNMKKTVGFVVFLSLFFSIGYSAFKIITTPENISDADIHTHFRSDYILMLLQCFLGLIVLGLPRLLERKWSFEIPNYMTTLYFIFLYCAIYLGEVHNFYYVIPHWDDILHAFSGAMLGALGFSLVSILNDSEKTKVSLSPLFVALFAFCFALAAGAFWEIYEFIGDGLFGLNMQKFRLADGYILSGHAALSDTMYDIIIDALAAFTVSVIGYLSLIGRIKYTQRKEHNKEKEEM